MVGVFPVLTWRQPIPLLGALLVPVVMVMNVVARVAPAHGSPAAAMPASSNRVLGLVPYLLGDVGIALFGWRRRPAWSTCAASGGSSAIAPRPPALPSVRR